jgi:two-component system cell cycle sensor histidine kinase/response regulator CckA
MKPIEIRKMAKQLNIQDALNANLEYLIRTIQRKTGLCDCFRIIGLNCYNNSCLFKDLCFDFYRTLPYGFNGNIERQKCSAQDICEPKRTDEILHNYQSLKSLVILASGIAHDFNNLLCGIFGNVELARANCTEKAVVNHLDGIMNTLNRARALTQQLLVFTKGGATVNKTTPLIPFIQEAANFALSGSIISCQYGIEGKLWLCNVDINQISRVINNIVLNARQAMSDVGRIDFSVCNIAFSEKEHSVLAKGNYVKISIKDTGEGMSKDIVSRILSSFYSTKQNGHGIGLATSYSIVSRYGGTIDVDSEPGIGSTFIIYLPAVQDTPVSCNTHVEPDMISGRGNILLMDDEEFMRKTVSDMLRSLGYETVCVNDGKEVVARFTQCMASGTIFAAIILDFTIHGGMSGIDAVSKLREFDRAIPVVATSGYSNHPAILKPAMFGFSSSIAKPFTVKEIGLLLNKLTSNNT